jgi:hypothetical protein
LQSAPRLFKIRLPVANVNGGMTAWNNQKLPVTKG